MADIALVHDEGGDWIAMYVDGELVDESHSLSEDTVVSHLVGKTVDSLTNYEFDFLEIGRGYDTLAEYTDLRQW